MAAKRLKNIYIFIGTAILMTSCGLPKELLKVVDGRQKEMIEFPVDYCNLFPTTSFEQWDKDYNSFDRFLTRDIMRTQMGLSYNNNGVQTWWCVPSARTHVQLDTATMIADSKKVIGNWRIVCNRTITYEDSVVYADKKFYRTSKVIKDNKEDDVLLSMTADKFKLYAKEKGSNSFKKIATKNYQIESKRYLMLYGLSKAGSAISFIGIDKEDRLIINSFYVQERKVKGVYIVYQATMSQMIFKKMTT
ncbi:MAG: hypothetical protein QY303_04460 [Vicingaceae bacterium]|nr:MAG: hypothetical protein QY303_04460 [Vicingaceae bacterium]